MKFEAGMSVSIAPNSTSYRGKYSGCTGVIRRISSSYSNGGLSGSVGVALDDLVNESSGYGLFWFKIRELIETESTSTMWHSNASMQTVTCCFDEATTQDDSKLFYKEYIGMFMPYKEEETKMNTEVITIAQAIQNLSIIKLAKTADERTIQSRCDMDIKRLTKIDPVVMAVLARVQEDDPKACLEAYEESQLITKVTKQAIVEKKVEKEKDCKAIDKFYVELYATLELPGADIAAILTNANILHENGYSLVNSTIRLACILGE